MTTVYIHHHTGCSGGNRGLLHGGIFQTKRKEERVYALDRRCDVHQQHMHHHILLIHARNLPVDYCADGADVCVDLHHHRVHLGAGRLAQTVAWFCYARSEACSANA